jgi:hypothetical protein
MEKRFESTESLKEREGGRKRGLAEIETKSLTKTAFGNVFSVKRIPLRPLHSSLFDSSRGIEGR